MQIKLFEDGQDNDNNRYSKKVMPPHYTPSDKKPELFELFNSAHYGKLLADINSSSISEEQKQFLRFAATRHIVFNYAKIADYYAHAEPEMQRLMEQSALVIIDINDAIANGYVKFSTLIKDISEASGVFPDEK